MFPPRALRVTASEAPKVTAEVEAIVIPPPALRVRADGLEAIYKVEEPLAIWRLLLMVAEVEPRLTVRPEAPVAVTVFREEVEVTEPVPVAVRVTLVPDSKPAREIEELPLLVTREIAPEEVRLLAPTVMVAELALSVRVTEAGLLVTLEILTAVDVSVRVTCAVVLREIMPADVVRVPMLPAPLDELIRERVPDVVREPAD